MSKADSGGLSVNCDFDNNSLERVNKILAGIPGATYKAAKSALPSVVSKLKAESSKAVRERYDVSAANIRASEKITAKILPQQEGVSAFVRFSGRKIPLYKYNGTTPKYPTKNKSAKMAKVLTGNGWRTLYPGAAASAHQLKTTAPKEFKNAFVARMQSGHLGIFQRTGGVTYSGIDEIREVMGSAVPQMLGSGEVRNIMEKLEAEVYEKEMERQVIKMLNGWR